MKLLTIDKKVLNKLNQIKIPKEFVYSKNLNTEFSKGNHSVGWKVKIKKTECITSDTCVHCGLLEEPSLDFVKDGFTRYSNFGYFGNVRLESDRILLFSESDKCVCCGIEGAYFKKKLEAVNNDYSIIRGHLNLYAIDKNTNKEILMTKDHIIPKSLGGANHLSNYQTCCTNCNRIKSANMITLIELRELLLTKETSEIISLLNYKGKGSNHTERIINEIKARLL